MTSQRVPQRNPERFTLDELIEMRVGARALRDEYAAQNLDPPEWLAQGEAELDAEIESRFRFEKLRLLSELEKEQPPDQDAKG